MGKKTWVKSQYNCQFFLGLLLFQGGCEEVESSGVEACALSFYLVTNVHRVTAEK